MQTFFTQIFNSLQTKRLFSFVTLNALALTAALAQVANNPKANDKAVVTCGNARFTVLTPEMIRIEYSDKAAFEDRATFTVVNRNLTVPQFTKKEDLQYLYITTSALELKYRKGSDPRTVPASSANLSVVVKNHTGKTTWYPGKPDPLNLKGTCRTLDGLMGEGKRSEMENGLVSRSGWAVIDDSWTTPRSDGGRSYALAPNATVGYDWWAERADSHAMDTYLLGYGNNYKQALADYTKIAGSIPLPPDYVFGYWYSKYSSYSADDYRKIMSDLKSNNIPADVMILDMDWHWNGNAGSMSEGRGGWTGWSWNTNLIPDGKGLLKEMHDQHFKTALNLHPADGVNKTESPDYFAKMNAELGGKYLNDAGDNISWSIDYPDFTNSFFKNIIRDHESEGVDFWWLDWQQWLTSPYTNSLSETFWCNHVFFNEAAKREGKRPVIFHRWGGLGSHRYPIGFSGDSFTTYGTLAWQPYFTATASNVGFGYWGHDLGGHQQTGGNDPEIYLRWMQFGVFTPIFRTHATNWEGIERRIWKYPNFPSLLETVKLRYALMPYIYTAARQAYDTGVSLCRPLYYEWPEVNNAYLFEDEYMFGDDILVAPVVTKPESDGMTARRTWLPEGRWFDVCRNKVVEGNRTFTDRYAMEEIPYFFRAGSVMVNNPPMMNLNTRPDRLILKVVPGGNGQTKLYEDEGDTEGYKQGAYTTTTISHEGNTLTILPREGKFAGMPESRSYTVEFLVVNRPNAVVINGSLVAESEWKYDAQRRLLTVNVARTSCDKKTVVSIK